MHSGRWRARTARAETNSAGEARSRCGLRHGLSTRRRNRRDRENVLGSARIESSPAPNPLVERVPAGRRVRNLLSPARPGVDVPACGQRFGVDERGRRGDGVRSVGGGVDRVGRSRSKLPRQAHGRQRVGAVMVERQLRFHVLERAGEGPGLERHGPRIHSAVVSRRARWAAPGNGRRARRVVASRRLGRAELGVRGARDAIHGADLRRVGVLRERRHRRVELFDTADGGNLVKIANGAVGKAPQPGDIISFNNPYLGHVGVVAASNVDASGNGSITMLSQNDTADGWRTLAVTHWTVASFGDQVPYGWLHDPRGRGGANAKPAKPTRTRLLDAGRRRRCLRVRGSRRLRARIRCRGRDRAALRRRRLLDRRPRR